MRPKGKTGTRKKILISALNMFSHYGYKGASIRMIARDVGIRESSVYSHFKSKAQILSTLVEEYKSVKVSAEIISEDILDYIDDPPVFMRKFCDKIFNYWNTPHERSMLRLFLIEQFNEHKDAEIDLSGFLKEIRDVWRFVFEQMIKFKLIKKADANLLADEFTAPLFLIRFEYLADEKGENLQKSLELAYKHAEFFWNAIKV